MCPHHGGEALEIGMKARNALNRPNTDRSPPRRLSRAWPLLIGVLLLAVSCSEGTTTPPLDVPDELAFVMARTQADYGLIWALNTESGGVPGHTRVGTFTGGEIEGVTVTPDGTKAYANTDSGISVIEVATGTVTATVPVVGSGLAVTSDGTKVYAASLDGISVIEVSPDTITRTINLGGTPWGAIG